MSDQVDLIGRVVLSKAGRDRGRAFLVVCQEGSEYVYVVDGRLRHLERPKKKKRKHLSIQPTEAETIRAKLLEGKQVFDAEIRNCLKNLGYNIEDQKEEG